MTTEKPTEQGASYFGYGTLLGTSAMQEYCPSARPRAVASYRGHALEFRQYSSDPHRCGCNLRVAEAEELYGVVYDLSAEDMEVLDAASGVPQGWFKRVPIIVSSLDGAELATTTYRLSDPGELQTPASDYLNLVRTGAQTAGLPAGYVEFLLDRLDRLAA